MVGHVFSLDGNDSSFAARRGRVLGAENADKSTGGGKFAKVNEVFDRKHARLQG
jgi:hypothetical protein